MTVTLLGRHIGNAVFWLVWFQMLAVLGSLATRGKDPRPGADDDEASTALTVRTRIVITVGLVVLASLGREHPSRLIVGAFFGALAVLIAMEMKGGVLRKHDLLDHPPTAPEPLDPIRKVIAIGTLLMFALLFMPEPFGI